MECPYCNSSDIRKTGLLITTKGKKQRYQCKACGRTFHPKEEQSPRDVAGDDSLPEFTCRTDHTGKGLE